MLKDDNYGYITTEADIDEQYNNMTRDYLQLPYDGIKNQDFKTNKVSIMQMNCIPDQIDKISWLT